MLDMRQPLSLITQIRISAGQPPRMRFSAPTGSRHRSGRWRRSSNVATRSHPHPAPAASPPSAAGSAAEPAAHYDGRPALPARRTHGHWPGPPTPAPPPRPGRPDELFAAGNAPAPPEPVPGMSASGIASPGKRAGAPARSPPPAARRLEHRPRPAHTTHDIGGHNGTSRARHGHLPAVGPHPDQLTLIRHTIDDQAGQT
jgi:hypothetical protein